MTPSLRIVLITSALLVMFFIVRKIRKFQIQTMDAVFWLLYSFSFVILALFPQLAEVVSNALGFQSSSNFVFLYVIAVLVMRDFSATVKYAKMRDKIIKLVQEIALKDCD